MAVTTSSGAISAAPGQTKAARGGGPGAPTDSRAERLTSTDPADFPHPSGREEEWRFTPLERISALLEPLPDPAEPKVDVQAPAVVSVGQVSAADPIVGSVVRPADRIAALARAGIRHATVMRIPAHAELDEPVVVTIDATGEAGYAHLVLDVGPFATASVVIERVGSGSLAATTEIRVGDGAALSVVSVQDADRDAVHVEALGTLVGRDARVRSLTVTLGGDLVRLSPSVQFAGPGGEAELAGLFFTGSGQHHEHQLFIDHQQPRCRSRAVYKGALLGEGAHSVWIGDVLIGSHAEGTDTYELNRNLVLSDGARADSVPNLEIQTGEVAGAGHASATGRFDDEQLFYCMARGIPAETARRLVVRGFFAEVLGQLTYAPLRQRLEGRIDELLEVRA